MTTKKDDRSQDNFSSKKGSIPWPVPIPGMPPGTPHPEVPWPDDIPKPGEPPSVPPTEPINSPIDPHKGGKKKP